MSRQTACRGWRRYRVEGPAGLADRPSRPHRCPTRTRRELERKICSQPRRFKLGPARIGARLGVPVSSVYALLRRYGLRWLSWLDRPSGEPIRRYERRRPGSWWRQANSCDVTSGRFKLGPARNPAQLGRGVVRLRAR